MKTGFSTAWTSMKQAERLLPAIAEAGFDGMEPTFNAGMVPGPDDYAESALNLKRYCENRGLEIPGMRGGRLFWNTIPSPDRAERERAVEHCRRGLEAVAAMGGDVLLVVPGAADSSVPFHDHRSRVVEFVDRVSDHARSTGVKIGLENTEARFPESLEEWKGLLRDVGSDHVGMYLDVGNVLWNDVGDPEKWIRELAPWLLRIHFKDSYTGMCIVDILEGDVDWKSVMEALRSIGYDGWILLEPDFFRFAPELLPGQLMARLQAVLSL
jgi:hexulose-6-phosphate isomerase